MLDKPKSNMIVSTCVVIMQIATITTMGTIRVKVTRELTTCGIDEVSNRGLRMFLTVLVVSAVAFVAIAVYQAGYQEGKDLAEKANAEDASYR